MPNSFPPHLPPNQSKLERWRSDIEQMRQALWPYHKIAAWLEEHKGCHAHKDTIRKFCLVRQIEKGNHSSKENSNSRPKPRSKEPPSDPQEEKLFCYDEEDSERPIEIKRR